MNQPGEVTKRTVLNVFGPMGHGGRYILDSLKTGALLTEFYHDSDLMVGARINVWGREFLLCGCDEFTQEYYRHKYGMGMFTVCMTFKALRKCKSAIRSIYYFFRFFFS